MKTTLLIVLCSLALFSSGQSDQRSNSVFLELAGSGGIASLNYERQFSQKENTSFYWRAGLSIAPIDRNNGTGIVFPLMATVLAGRSAHKLEAGIGQGITLTTKGKFFALTTLAIGYRYQPNDARWFYRATYTPLISYLVDFQIQQWGGLSIGYTFK